MKAMLGCMLHPGITGFPKSSTSAGEVWHLMISSSHPTPRAVIDYRFDCSQHIKSGSAHAETGAGFPRTSRLMNSSITIKSRRRKLRRSAPNFERMELVTALLCQLFCQTSSMLHERGRDKRYNIKCKPPQGDFHDFIGRPEGDRLMWVRSGMW